MLIPTESYVAATPTASTADGLVASRGVHRNMGGKMPIMKAAPRILALAVLFAAAPSLAAAQEPERAVMVLAGPSQYDLSGTGTAAFAAVRLELPLGNVVLLEPGLAYLGYTAQFGSRVHHLLPEVQLQVQWPGAVVRPYLGAGFGGSWAVSPGEDVFDLTLSGAGGLRASIAADWAVVGELRIRVIDPWVGTTADWAIGVARRF